MWSNFDQTIDIFSFRTNFAPNHSPPLFNLSQNSNLINAAKKNVVTYSIVMDTLDQHLIK